MHVNLSSICSFDVGPFVHRSSWGKRSRKTATTTTTNTNNNEPLWSANHFTLEQNLGRGHFGCVYRATHHQYRNTANTNSNSNKKDKKNTSSCTQQIVALKTFCKKEILYQLEHGGRSLELLQREVNIHSCIQHPHIINFMGYFENPESLSMVLQYAPHGDLLDFMVKLNRCSDSDSKSSGTVRQLEMARLAVRQVCSALTYLESLHIAHRDIKPENLLVTANSHIRLCDFGWAVWFRQGQFHRTLCGTPEFCPPEMLRRPRRYRAGHVDQWALGVLAFELVHGRSPFQVQQQQLEDTRDDDNNDVAAVDTREMIFDKIRNFARFPSSSSSSSSYKSSDNQYDGTNSTTIVAAMDDFCSQLMQVQPEDRMTPGRALEHPFLSLGSGDSGGTKKKNKDKNKNGSSSSSSSNDNNSISSIRPTVAQRCQLFQQTR